MKKTKQMLKDEIKEIMDCKNEINPRMKVEQTVELLIDFFDERITKIEKATGFMGVGGH